MKQILSINWVLVFNLVSLTKYWANPKEPFDLGIIVSLSKGSAPYKNQETAAWPDSWTATLFFYYGLIILFL